MPKIPTNIMIEKSDKNDITRIALEESIELNERISFSKMIVKLAKEAIEIRSGR